MEYFHSQFTNRWLAYFDVLGFTEMVKNNTPFAKQLMLDTYSELMSAMKDLAQEATNHSAKVTPVWFSDSFMIYTEEDSALGYRAITSAAKRISERHVNLRVPSCGTVVFGELFADIANNVFIGKALCDAVGLEQTIRSVGLYVDNSAAEKASSYKLYPIRHGFAQIEQGCLAYTFPRAAEGSENMYAATLKAMRGSAPEMYRHKYDLAIRHIEQHWLR